MYEDYFSSGWDRLVGIVEGHCGGRMALQAIHNPMTTKAVFLTFDDLRNMPKLEAISKVVRTVQPQSLSIISSIRGKGWLSCIVT